MQPMTPTSRVDGLAAEDGVFYPLGSLDYRLAVRRVLLTHPDVLLQMVVLPSFEPEYAVFVCGPSGRPRRRGPQQTERTLVAGRLVTQLWGAAAEQCLAPPDARGVRIAYHPTKETFAGLSPEVDWARAPLADSTYQRVRAAWDAALADVRGDRTSIGCDGETYHFAAGIRAGKTWSPTPDSVCAGLVALGESLVELARLTNEAERSEREEAVAANANRLLMRIQASQ